MHVTRADPELTKAQTIKQVHVNGKQLKGAIGFLVILDQSSPQLVPLT